MVRSLIANGAVTAVHDISDGGLLVAVAEMALAGNLGVELDAMDTAFAFNESQARYLVTYRPDSPLDRDTVRYEQIGTVGGDAIRVNGATITLAELRRANESFFEDFDGPIARPVRAAWALQPFLGAGFWRADHRDRALSSRRTRCTSA